MYNWISVIVEGSLAIMPGGYALGMWS
jgi:hypothetical protein